MHSFCSSYCQAVGIGTCIIPPPSPTATALSHPQQAVAWHPSGALLATTSADGRLRLFNGVVPGVDTQTPLPALEGTRFGDCLLEVALPGGWGLAVAFSPSGNCLAAASQASQLTLLSGISLQDASSLDATSAAASGRLQHLHLPGLPLKILAFLSEDLLAGGGFDCQPVLCTRAADGQWRYARSLKGALVVFDTGCWGAD